MKVIVVTPFYYIKDRPKLFHDTSCVHYLLKYWPKNTEIYVFNEYHMWFKNWNTLLDKEEYRYFKNGYSFVEDSITVNMIEIPILPRQKKLLNFQKRKMSNFINNYFKENGITPDIAIFHQPSYYCGQYLNELNLTCPKIGILHFSDVIEYNRNKRFGKQLSMFDKLYARSEYIKNYFKGNNFNNVNDDIIYSGTPFHGDENGKTFSSNSKYNILYVGKLIKRKNADMLIESFNDLKEKVGILTIVGEGREFKRLKRLVSKFFLEKRVIFIPKLSRKEVFDYMSRNEIFAMPSTGETVGLVYLEAMSKGCITIATKDEGIDGIIINGKNGFLVKANNQKNLTEVLNSIINSDKEILSSISKEAIKTAKQFDEKIVSEEYYRIIEREKKENEKKEN